LGSGFPSGLSLKLAEKHANTQILPLGRRPTLNY